MYIIGGTLSALGILLMIAFNHHLSSQTYLFGMTMPFPFIVLWNGIAFCIIWLVGILIFQLCCGLIHPYKRTEPSRENV